ncbi:TIGR04500 family putative peptide maturation system protein [Rhodococcus maanshanensis]|uniref:Putative peptide maturation system protein n=1 Tax=Rhodococcus maanshanensis TaxID=183556 RepID=A0A1H7TUP5_9NOCA|nr:TIGR04500 family putative peptide maturation system protein [Rhodococcus maanshanensis]SEL88461.1 putative peptide maturation system protein [Rhodococcus maanshanensis]
MTAPTPTLLAEALSLLVQLNESSARPDPREALAPLRARHPRTRMRLLRHREALDDSMQYGLLLTETGVGTATLSWAPERAIPWSLRGTQRTAESMLLRVNGEALAIEEAMAYLDVMWERTELLDRLISVCLIKQELAENPVRLEPGVLQDAMDAFRRARGLLTVADTERWMRARTLSHTALEELVEREAAIAELKRRVVADRGHAWLAENVGGLDRARVATVRFAERTEAERFLDLVRARMVDGGEDAVGAFGAAAAAEFAASATLTGVEMTEVVRCELPESLAGPLFLAEPSEVLGPVSDEPGWRVVQVLARTRAASDAQADRAVAEAVFAQWLAERHEAARIEWFWGDAAKTPTGAPVHRP